MATVQIPPFVSQNKNILHNIYFIPSMMHCSNNKPQSKKKQNKTKHIFLDILFKMSKCSFPIFVAVFAILILTLTGCGLYLTALKDLCTQ